MIKVTRPPGQRGDIQDYVHVIIADTVPARKKRKKRKAQPPLGGKRNAFLSASTGGNKRLQSERTETSPQVRQWEGRERRCAPLLPHPKS